MTTRFPVWRLAQPAPTNRALQPPPARQRLATASYDGRAKVWSLEKAPRTDGGRLVAREMLTLAGHADWIRAVAFSPDGSKLATASDDRTAKVWDAATGEELSTLTGHDDFVGSVAFSPDGTRLATASWDGTARIGMPSRVNSS